MKITDMKIFVVGNPWKNWVFLKLYTDEGVEGLGEATGGLWTKPIVGQLEEIKQLVIGEDPRKITWINDKIFKALFLNNVGPAAAAINIACWDIVGKIYGAPLYQLLGGKCREKIRVYANGWYQGPRDPSFFAERAIQIVEMGYTALKFDPFGNSYMYMDNSEKKLAVAIVKAIRESVGDDVDILIEGHDRLSISEAVRMGDMLEEFKPMWFETPVLSSDISAVNEVARKVRIPVIAGERVKSANQLAELLNPRVINMVNPELLQVGGINGLMDCFAVARSFGAHVAPHNAQSPLCTSVNVHIDIINSNLLIQECFDDSSVKWTDDVLQGYSKVKNGYICPTDAPGIGVTFNEKEAARHPYGERNFLRLFDQGWERRNN